MKEKKTLTVFTPAYNRAHTIGRTYESLCRQTSKDFCWLIVDDGSQDNTGELVQGWIEEGKVDITYIHQKNQGMHGAHNTAYRNIDTELNVCIDSDDWMPDDAVEKIVAFWLKNGAEQYAGFIGLDSYADGSVIGDRFPDDLKKTKARWLWERYHFRGDKKYVYRTDVIRKYPETPVFEGEKYFSLAYLYTLIDNDYDMLLTNDVLAVIEYQDDGSSRSMWKQYWNNPKGFAFMRKYDMETATTFKRRLVSCLHYVSHSIRCKNWKFIQETPCKLLTVLCLIPGSILYLVNRHKVKADKLMNIKGK